MNELLKRHLSLLMLLSVFLPIPDTYGQMTSYAALRHAGRTEDQAGRYGKAEILLLGALEEAQRKKDEYAVAEAHGDLGGLYQNVGRRIEAEQSYRKALSIFSRMPGMNFETAHALRNLASVYAVTGRESDAIKLLEDALKLLDRNTPDEQILAAHILNGIAVAYFQQGKMSSSETVLLQALRMRSAAEPNSDLIDSHIQNNLGTVYEKQHKYTEAEESHKRSLKIAEHLLGPVHPHLSIILSNLGSVYVESRRLGEAKDQYERSFSILERVSPVSEGMIVPTLQGLAGIYVQQGEEACAERLLARAVELALRNPVPGPIVAALLDAYANVLKTTRKAEEAQQVGVLVSRTWPGTPEEMVRSHGCFQERLTLFLNQRTTQ